MEDGIIAHLKKMNSKNCSFMVAQADKGFDRIGASKKTIDSL